MAKNDKAKKEVEEIKEDVVSAEIEPTTSDDVEKEEVEEVIPTKSTKSVKYVAVTNIKEDRKLIKVGEAYTGKYAQKLLEIGSIKESETK